MDIEKALKNIGEWISKETESRKYPKSELLGLSESLQALKAEIARQPIKSEDVQRAIEQLKYAREQDREFDDGTFVDSLDLAITALQEYQPWIPVSERLPESGKEVLMNVAYNNRNQSEYDKVAKGFYVESFSIKEETWSDFTGNEDYCEEDDTYYIRQGWYSVCNFVDDFSYIDVPSGFTVTHWKPLSAPPKG